VLLRMLNAQTITCVVCVARLVFEVGVKTVG